MWKILAAGFLLVFLLAANGLAQTATKPLGVGVAAPDFTLTDHHGRKVTLSDSKNKNPVVLVFYRGYW